MNAATFKLSANPVEAHTTLLVLVWRQIKALAMDGHQTVVEVRTAEDGLIKDLGTGLILFQPGPDRPVEELNTNQNCVVAFVFDQLEGPSAAQPVTWCFEAT